jgi:hypothetical protein
MQHFQSFSPRTPSCGIGLVLVERPEGLVVSAINPHGAAAQSGANVLANGSAQHLFALFKQITSITQPADTLVSVNGHRTKKISSVKKYIQDRQPGAPVALELRRSGMPDFTVNVVPSYARSPGTGQSPLAQFSQAPLSFASVVPHFPTAVGGGNDTDGSVLGRKILISEQQQGRFKQTKVEHIPRDYSLKKLVKVLQKHLSTHGWVARDESAPKDSRIFIHFSVHQTGEHIEKSTEEFLVFKGYCATQVIAFLIENGIADLEGILRR